MTDWIVRGQETLLANSRAAEVVRAKREWRMTYGYVDLGSPRGTCELCGHTQIRHKFEIENATTQRHLWIGSECIKKFVPVFEKGVEITDEAEKSRHVDRITAAAKTLAQRDRALALLRALARHDSRFGDAKWRVEWELGYSVKQLQWIAVAAKNAALAFNAGDFKINTRRGRVQEQLYKLELWQYRQLRAALNPSRRKEADAYFRLTEQ